jgi:hypothetical protein
MVTNSKNLTISLHNYYFCQFTIIYDNFSQHITSFSPNHISQFHHNECSRHVNDPFEKLIDTFDQLCDERLLLDENLNTVKTSYKDYQAKLSDPVEVILPEQFDLLYYTQKPLWQLSNK